MEGVRPERVQWFEIRNAVDVDGDGAPDTTEVMIYDEIGGWCGVSPAAFRNALNKIETPNISLRIHSPGGNAFDGVAIYNTIRSHPSHITAHIDGLAASAASYIALAADEVVMSEAAQLMIHDAWGVVVGPASDLDDVSAQLNKMSDNIAKLYAKKAGGSVEFWRDAMRAESWYTDEEAVAAGLADRVADDVKAADVKAAWNLSVFMYGGRAQAPEPPMPAGRTLVDLAALAKRPAPVVVTAANRDAPPVAPRISPAQAAAKIANAPVASRANGPTNRKVSAMDAVKLREALNLPADATDDEVRAALSSGGLGAPVAPPPANTTETVDPSKLAEMAEQTGAVLVDTDFLRQLRESAMKGEQAFDSMRRQERDGIISQAVKDGKFPMSAAGNWAKLWDADPEGTRKAINNLARNVIPVVSAGYAQSMDEISETDMAYNGLYGEAGR